MTGKFQQVVGNWTDLRGLPNMVEVDFHYEYERYQERHLPWHQREPFEVKMDQVHAEALAALKEAQAKDKQYVMLRHGSSTSGPGQRSARSVVRNLMRSKTATPYIVRSQCVEHDSVFVAAIRLPAKED